MNICPGCGYSFQRQNPLLLETCSNCLERMKRNAKVRKEQEERWLSVREDDSWFTEDEFAWNSLTHCRNGHAKADHSVRKYGYNSCLECARLRGDNRGQAVGGQAPRLHCRNGHETAVHSYKTANGFNKCRECKRLHKIDYRSRQAS